MESRLYHSKLNMDMDEYVYNTVLSAHLEYKD